MPDLVRTGLTLQGYACDTDSTITAGERWLRFTPILSTLCIVTGTLLASPSVLWGFTFISALGAAGWHPFDALFNGMLRHLVGRTPLPPNPVPRRFAMGMAAVWSAGAGWLIAAGFVNGGVAAAGALALAGALVATTHFCVGSWFYRLVWRRPVPGA